MTVANIEDFALAMEGEANSGIEVFDLRTLMETGPLVKGSAYRAPSVTPYTATKTVVNNHPQNG